MMAGTTLLIGPSSVGKSTWIMEQKARGAISDDRIHFAFQFDDAQPPLLDGKRLVHINMLHPFGSDVDMIDVPIEASAVMQAISAQVRPSEAIVMVAPRATLVKRILLRSALEPDLVGTKNGYPVHPNFEFVCRVDLGEIYLRWFAFLGAVGIPYRIIATGGPDYTELRDPASAIAYFHSDVGETYSKSEREQVLARFRFDYQRIDGINTIGFDRAASYEAIRPHVAGFSVIDIGCGLGYFARRLELDGITDVIGTEFKKDRFLAACVLGALDNSRVRYEFGYTFAARSKCQADTVLLLNVIHHLREPLDGLRQAWGMARQRLIIEFPTLDDERYRSTLPPGASIDNSLPLIGVSSLKAVDQTFVFSETAIARILDEDTYPPIDLTFLPSPLAASRRIAVATKGWGKQP